KFYIFKDLTALGQYSLSKQTRQVIGGLDDDYILVTMMNTLDQTMTAQRLATIRQTIDLVDVYARQSPHITAEHYDSTRDVARLERFFATLASRYDEELQPMQQA